MLHPLPTAPARAHLAWLSPLLLVLATGCSREVFHSEAGSGYRIGLTVAPAVAILALSLAGLLAYLAWRRSTKR